MKRFTKEEVKDYISDLAQQVKDEMITIIEWRKAKWI